MSESEEHNSMSGHSTSAHEGADDFVVPSNFDHVYKGDDENASQNQPVRADTPRPAETSSYSNADEFGSTTKPNYIPPKLEANLQEKNDINSQSNSEKSNAQDPRASLEDIANQPLQDNSQFGSAKQFGTGTLIWEKDEDVAQCRKCSTTFNFFQRRHHCRACGRIFCDVCTENFLLLPPLPQFGSNGYATPVRVCNACFANFNITKNFSKQHFHLFPKTSSANTQEHFGSQSENNSNNSNNSNENQTAKVGDNDLLIMIHGAPFSRQIFAGIAEDLANKISVVTVDLPCHGSKFEDEYALLNMDTIVYQIHQTLQKVGSTGRVFLMGQNLGAAVGLAFARKYPEKVGGLIVIGSLKSCFSPSCKLGRFALSSRLLTYSYLSQWSSSDFGGIIPQTELEEHILRCGSHPRAISRSKAVFDSFMKSFWMEEERFQEFLNSQKNQVGGLSSEAPSEPQSLPEDKFPNYHFFKAIPTLLIAGDQASDRNEKEEEEFFQTFLKSQVVVLRGASEMMYLEPKVKGEFSESILNWIETCDKTGNSQRVSFQPKTENEKEALSFFSDFTKKKERKATLSYIPPEPVMIPKEDYESSTLMGFLTTSKKNDPFEL